VVLNFYEEPLVLGVFFSFLKIRMVPVLVRDPEKMGALSPVLIQFLEIFLKKISSDYGNQT